MPKFPLIPTILVLAAVATMIMLGFWQLGRHAEKTKLLVTYVTASTDARPVEWPETDLEFEKRLYRQASVECLAVVGRRTTAATSATGVKGLAQVATCQTSGGDEVEVALGFTRQPSEGNWQGGEVSGVIAPGPRLVASPPAEALEPLAKPDPRDLPNNHLAYAGQWFFFALTALVIYILALKRQQAGARRDED